MCIGHLPFFHTPQLNGHRDFRSPKHLTTTPSGQDVSLIAHVLSNKTLSIPPLAVQIYNSYDANYSHPEKKMVLSPDLSQLKWGLLCIF